MELSICLQTGFWFCDEESAHSTMDGIDWSTSATNASIYYSFRNCTYLYSLDRMAAVQFWQLVFVGLLVSLSAPVLMGLWNGDQTSWLCHFRERIPDGQRLF